MHVTKISGLYKDDTVVYTPAKYIIFWQYMGRSALNVIGALIASALASTVDTSQLARRVILQESPADARVTRDSAVIPTWLSLSATILDLWNRK